ncbi:MAG: hypothetical protein ACRD45_08970 [Bryobacteraceae bacterium]
MSTKNLPSRPNLEQYKKQAKDLLKEIQKSDASATMRVRASHPRYRDERSGIREFALADAQLVIAREHGFPSWTKFVSEIASIRLRLLAEAEGPVYAFLVAASVPRGAWHSSGTLAQAEELLKQHPAIPGSSIYTAAVLADDIAVRRFLKADPSLTTAKGGPYGWDALTYLCFSRYLRLDKERSGGFLAAAKALLDAGANANTGW